MGPGHPESPARLVAALDALAAPEFAAVERREAPPATREMLLRAHDAPWLDDMMARFPDRGRVQIDGDTALSPGSREAALRAAGAVTAAVDAVLAGDLTRAFCCIRPPGHHAEADRAMGFCLFNNIAVGAFHALASGKAARVAVVDFDVHHGNGTQAMFRGKPGLFYASTHQWPLYPGSGGPDDTGADNILNIPLPAGAGGTELRRATADHMLPALRQFAPDLLMISAGFDAHRDDPLAQMTLDDEDYGWITDRLVTLARETCAGRVVSALEGGYDTAALGRATAAHMRALMQD